jgi:hypothetical protein
MRWIDKPVIRLKKEKRISLRKKRGKSYKVISNALTIGNKNITQGTAIRNLNRIKQPKQRVNPKVRNEGPNKRSILKENGTK